VAVPNDILSMSKWYLTLPSGSANNPDEVYQPALATYSNSSFFRVGSDGACVEFIAPAVGVTTSAASGATRTELREMLDNSGSGAKSNWGFNDGANHSLTVTMTCDPTSVVGRKECIVGQIHDAGGTPPIYLAINLNSNPGALNIFKSGPSDGALLTGITPTTKFTYRILVTAGVDVKIYACLGDNLNNLVLQKTYPISTWSADATSGCYFKAGAYNKEPISTATSGQSIVRMYRLDHDVINTGLGGLYTPPAAPGGGSSGPQTLGVGGIPTPAAASNVVLTTADSTSTLSITTGGTSSQQRIYDGQGHTVKKIDIAASYVTVQNFFIRGADNAGIYSSGIGNIIQNCDIAQVNEGGVGDINGITFFGDGTKILFNNIDNLVSGPLNGSHTDGIQTWNTPSKRASSNVLILGNRINGPVQSDVNYLHQGVQAEGKDSTDGGGGGTGVSQNWLIDSNYFKTYGNQCIHIDDIDNVSIARNTFAGGCTKIVETGDFSTGAKYYSDNVVTGTYGSVGLTATQGAGPAPSAYGYVAPAGIPTGTPFPDDTPPVLSEFANFLANARTDRSVTIPIIAVALADADAWLDSNRLPRRCRFWINNALQLDYTLPKKWVLVDVELPSGLKQAAYAKLTAPNLIDLRTTSVLPINTGTAGTPAGGGNDGGASNPSATIVIIPSGTSAQRPQPDVGSAYIDLDLGRTLILGDGSGWRDVYGKSIGNGPQNIRAVVNTDNSITISWDPVPNATTYKLYEDQSLSGVSGATALTATTTTRAPSTNRTYHYWVTANISGVESDPSAKVAATLPYGSTPNPVPPGGGGSGTVTPDSFTFAFASCLNAADSNSFTKMKTMNPDYFAMTGDCWYDDGSSGHQAHWQAKFGAPNYAAFLATLPNPQIVGWSDHDFGFAANAVGSGNSVTPTANAAYRAQFPSVVLPSTDGIYRTWTRGRIRFILTDERSFKSANAATDNSSKTMLGTTQKNWLKGLIASSQYPIIVWIGDTPWVGPVTAGDDGWKGYDTERQELNAVFASSPAQIIRLNGDMHCLGYGHDQFGVDRVWQAAPLNNATKVKSAGEGFLATYPTNANEGAIEQLFGWISFTDNATTITATFTGYSADGTIRLTDSLSVTPSTTAPPPSGGGTPTGGTGSTPAEILKINGKNGGTGGSWNEGIGFHSGDAEGSGHKDISYSSLAGGYERTFYFEKAQNNTAVKFAVYCDGGKTSANTHYPRSELRELSSGGGSNASWDGASGTHHMSGTTRVVHGTSTKDEVCIAQMHDASDDTLQIRVQGSTVTLNVKGVKVADLLTGYTKGTDFDWDILCANGKLTVKINGVQKYSATPGYGSGQYFKVGCYAQAASGYTSGISASDYFHIELKNLAASHS
jgi:hypothetical protein